jgi:hypothetical protein
VLHGLGAAINRTINLALQLEQRFSDTLIVSLILHSAEFQFLFLLFQVSVNTCTVPLVDDVHHGVGVCE